MVALKIDWPHDQGVDANSAVQSGAKFYVYENETSILKTLYSDRDGLVTRANPVVADSAGRFDVVYVATIDLLTLALTTSADVPIESWDDIEPEVSTDLTELANYVARAGGDANRMTGPLELKEGAAIPSATSINLDAMTGNWAHVTGTDGIATMTLAQGSTRTLIFDDALTLTHSASLLLGGSDLTTHAGMALKFVGEGSGVTCLIGGMTASGKALVESAEILIGIGNESAALSAGPAKITFRMPFAMILDQLPRASLTTAQASGNIVTVDINESGTSILSTKLTIDNNKTTSATAATPAVLSDVSLADNAPITVDIDQCDGATTAAGLKVLLRGYRRSVA